MSSQVATRMTCFALLSSIEEDIRLIIKNISIDSGQDKFLPEDVRQNAIPRFIADINFIEIKRNIYDSELLPYLDFADLGKVLNIFKSEILSIKLIDISWISENLIRLASARNRVCHSRPLEVEDLPQFIDFSQSLQKQYSKLTWNNLSATSLRLHNEPTFVFYTTIPEYWRATKSRVMHNLPLAEFDDTGFVGRRDDRRSFDKHLRSANPVITLLGEGGTGKTALALRCLYDLVDRDDCPYELIVWVSLKSKSLTANGIQHITSTISNTARLLEEIETQFFTQPSESKEPNTEGSFSRIIEYMTVFKTILAIDNLETLPAQQLRELYTAIPAGSKLIITSRVGLGEAEVRVPVPALSPSDSAILFRSFARFLGKQNLASLNDVSIKRYCERLHYNPLLIKWFLSSVADGQDPQNLLAPTSKNLDAAISFCFENLYSSLNHDQHEIIQVLSCAGRPVADPELRFLLQDRLEGDSLQWALNLLHRSSILRTEIEQFGSGGDTVTRYSLTDIANQYISRLARPEANIYTEVQKRLSKIRWSEQEEGVRRVAYKYDPLNIHSVSKYDHVAAKDLRQALAFLQSHEFTLANECISRARSLHPSFSEVERIAAMVAADSGHAQEAEDHYRYAIELNPSAGITLCTYSNFLLRSDRYEDGMKYIEMALKNDPTDLTLLTKKAVFLTRLGKYEEAADLYVSILQHGPTFQKWRDATLYNAYDNYRRWAEAFSIMQDFGGARAKIALAINLWDQFSLQEIRTTRMRKLTWKLVNDTFFQLTLEDIEWSVFAVSWLEKVATTIGSADDEIRGMTVWRKKLISDPALSSRLEIIVSIFYGTSKLPINKEHPEMPIADLQHLIISDKYAIVDRYFIDKGFGFLKCPDGTELFFHKNGLIERNLEHLVCHGTTVIFELGENQTGPCAIKIKIVTP